MSATAAILAGGQGTRLRPAVSDRPKVLAEVSGRPFVAHLLDRLEVAGVTTAVLCLGYRGEQVREALGARHGRVQLRYSQEPSPAGTAGALRLVLPLCESDDIIAMNGDSISDIDVAAMLRWHVGRRAAATLALAYVPDVSRFGRADVAADGQIQRFSEKGAETGAGWINAGAYVLCREVIEAIPTERAVSLERDVFPGLAGRGLYGLQAAGRFLDIGTPASYREAEAFFSAAKPTRWIVMDRDGTLIKECHYLSDPERVELLPGAAAALRRLRRLGFGFVVITNQSAIGRGLFDLARLEAIHARLTALLAAEGVALDGLYVCPHTPADGCGCRKPEPGLLRQAGRELGFDPQECLVIGDKRCDVNMGRRVGATTFLVRTGYGVQEAEGAPADHVVDDLAAAAHVIAQGAGAAGPEPVRQPA